MSPSTSIDVNFNDSLEKYGFDPIQVITHLTPHGILPREAEICMCGHSALYHVSRECRGSLGVQCRCSKFVSAFQAKDYRPFIQETTGISSSHALQKGLDRYWEMYGEYPLFTRAKICYACKAVIHYLTRDWGVGHVHYATGNLDLNKRGQSRLFHPECFSLYYLEHAIDTWAQSDATCSGWFPEISDNNQ